MSQDGTPGGTPANPFDVAETDRLLSTTRAVRRRIDTDRDVPDSIIFDCIDVAEQAPSGGNDASRRWIVVRDPALRRRLGEIYSDAGQFMTRIADKLDGTGHGKEEIFKSSAHLVEHFGDAPVLVIAAIWGTHDDSGRPGLFDSVIQAAWSFNLALRARGLGTTWTTMLNARVDELAAELSIPPGVTTIVTFPVGYTKGTDFHAVARRPASEITYFDEWGFTRRRPSVDGTARIADGQGAVAEIDIAARPRAVWPFVADIEFPARAETELAAAKWTSAAPHGVGSTFVGRNKIGDREWEVTNHITAYETDRIFEWSTTDPNDPGAVWRLEIAELGVGSRLRFSVLIGSANNLTAARALEDLDQEEAVINGRRKMFKANMRRTIEAIKVAAENAG